MSQILNYVWPVKNVIKVINALLMTMQATLIFKRHKSPDMLYYSVWLLIMSQRVQHGSLCVTIGVMQPLVRPCVSFHFHHCYWLL